MFSVSVLASSYQSVYLSVLKPAAVLDGEICMMLFTLRRKVKLGSGQLRRRNGVLFESLFESLFSSKVKLKNN
jgi:hypothetical protein